MMHIAGLPERSFVRRFSKATGMSPLEYVHRLRIEEAKGLPRNKCVRVVVGWAI